MSLLILVKPLQRLVYPTPAHTALLVLQMRRLASGMYIIDTWRIAPLLRRSNTSHALKYYEIYL